MTKPAHPGIAFASRIRQALAAERPLIKLPLPLALGVTSVLLGACRQHPFSKESERTRGAHWLLDTTPAISILANGDKGPARFDGAVGAARVANNAIVIGDQSTGTLKFFDAFGHLISVVTLGAGDSSQHSELRWMARCPGSNSLVAQDIRRQQLTFFSDGGVVTRRVQLPAELTYMQVLSCGADGTLLALLAEPTHKPVGGGIVNAPAALIRVRADGRSADTVLRLPGTEFYFARDVPVYFEVPLGSAARAAFAGDHGFVGETTDNVIKIVDTEGRSLGKIALAVEPNASRVRDLLAAIASRVAEEPERELRALLRQGMAESPLHIAVPPYSRLVADSAGNLWVRTSMLQANTESWQVYSPLGKPKAWIEMPFRLRPMEIGDDYVLAIERSRVDSERVVMYNLSKESRSPAPKGH